MRACVLLLSVHPTCLFSDVTHQINIVSTVLLHYPLSPRREEEGERETDRERKGEGESEVRTEKER